MPKKPVASESRVIPPVEYLLECSEFALQDFILHRADRVARLRAELGAVVEEYAQAAAEMELAALIGVHRSRIKRPVARALQHPLPLGVKRAG